MNGTDHLALSGWVVYGLNALIVVLYLAGAIAVGRRRGRIREWEMRTWIAVFSFFVFCAITHFELAWIAIDSGEYYVNPNGSANSWLIFTLAGKAISLGACIWTMVVPPPPQPRRERKRRGRG